MVYITFGFFNLLFFSYRRKRYKWSNLFVNRLFQIIFTGVFDGLDGTIARTYGKTSRYGDYLDHTIDRIVDIAFILAIAHNSAWIINPIWGWAAALTTLLGSYMGTQAQSVGLGRNYGGFGRADRIVITLVGVLLASLQVFFEIQDPNWMGIDWNPMILIIFISLIGGIYTFFSRFFAAIGDLKELDKQEPLMQIRSPPLKWMSSYLRKITEFRANIAYTRVFMRHSLNQNQRHSQLRGKRMDGTSRFEHCLL